MLKRKKPLVEFTRALLGDTGVGVTGALLQWLTLAILLSLVLFVDSLTPRVAVALAFGGVVTLLSGLALSFHGKSLGPILVIPGVLGILILLILTALLYPLRWLTKKFPNLDSSDQ